VPNSHFYYFATTNSINIFIRYIKTYNILIYVLIALLFFARFSKIVFAILVAYINVTNIIIVHIFMH